MALLKEDGSLDVKWIDNLQFEQRLKVFAKLTQEQKDEYFSKQPLNESRKPIIPTEVSYTMEEELANGCVMAKEFLNNLRKKHGKL